MKQKNQLLFGILALMLVLSLCLASCATNVASSKPTKFSDKPISLNNPRNYEILGPISLEKNWWGILGFTLPSYSLPVIGGGTVTVAAYDGYLVQAGGVTYLDLFEKAKDTYWNVDAVVDINIDHASTVYGGFYATRRNIVTGIAIRYVREPDTSSTAVVDLKLDIKE